LQARGEFGQPADGFGHLGAGGSTHGAWPRLRVGFSYAMNRLGDEGDARPRALLDALSRALHSERRPRRRSSHDSQTTRGSGG
jgi:hypothetical protein